MHWARSPEHIRLHCPLLPAPYQPQQLHVYMLRAIRDGMCTSCVCHMVHPTCTLTLHLHHPLGHEVVIGTAVDIEKSSSYDVMLKICTYISMH
jgi:hypothetical protein